jgi:hypothetical protein
MQDWPFPNQVIDEPVNQDGLIWKEYGSVQQQGKPLTAFTEFKLHPYVMCACSL